METSHCLTLSSNVSHRATVLVSDLGVSFTAKQCYQRLRRGLLVTIMATLDEKR